MQHIGWLAGLALGIAGLSGAVQAQTRPTSQAARTVPAGPGTTMWVRDASGSMWGPIQGRAKIEIAREAVGSMLQAWPRNRQLGLMSTVKKRSEAIMQKSPTATASRGTPSRKARAMFV